MKLILCPSCEDVFKLALDIRRCTCGKSWGRYLAGGIDAEISATAVPIGFANSTLLRAIRSRPDHGLGVQFTAFVIARECESISVRGVNEEPDTSGG
ncbi:hypothetical protein [Pinirhizobacter soli]|uniref:hypothetical protein n=1 Tax=Pinirhizobacter soli TaxID=2786953 RepID=UPI00202A8F4B|nr:hypothetical protein [Pinirhizobacter soli]